MPSAASCVIGSIMIRSAPVSRSRNHKAVRGPKRCPLKEIVPFGNALICIWSQSWSEQNCSQIVRLMLSEELAW